ncbi:enediyne biosynthesis protein [Saccharothrix sp. ALI-22-I]|uniref:DUF1702 family protein n=1 Tax=Saccharothrix sp. ALI-22-I TaxID=1933778 RepID=UPI00097C8AB0|nr:DUF1702 family protein [Saccharothrix sp. ALI-22-I]ONI89794.1 enediyne biosynthesis protein [Saccharothrix sp. ALI-22-I]
MEASTLTHFWRSLRRRVLTPDASATLLEVRGFHIKNPAAQQLLETVGEMFLTGYGFAAEAKDVAMAETNLETIPEQFRGFAYEGAAMGYCVRDGIPFGSNKNFSRFLSGRAEKHDYMSYIGMGWAMARLPRFRWPTSTGIDPLMVWMVLDGYGFHQAYFKTDRYVHEQYRAAQFRWPTDGPQWYANHAIDQGVGRALWFVGGTDPEVVASLIGKFDEERRSDLFAGAGLAATYAGGADATELRMFRDLAGPYQPQLAQGAAFAAEARLRAGLVVPHTAVATEVFCGTSPEKAAQITRDTRPDRVTTGKLPAFEVWRRRVAGEFVSLGRS